MTILLRHEAGPVVPSVRELWAELSASMRILRRNARISLRDAESATGRGRGILSQIENAKARPNRDLVEWYDQALGGDGVLLAMYFEARGAHGSDAFSRTTARHVRAGDVVSVSGQTLAHGALVRAGATDLAAGWTLTNDGSVSWVDRRLRRVGAHAAARLIASDLSVDLPDCAPGDHVDVRIPFTVPTHLGTFAAYWQVVDEDGCACFEPPILLSVQVVATE